MAAIYQNVYLQLQINASESMTSSQTNLNFNCYFDVAIFVNMKNFICRRLGFDIGSSQAEERSVREIKMLHSSE